MPRKKKKNNYYFTEITEKAIVDYCNTDSLSKRSELYIQHIQPAFDELVNKIVYTYKFTSLDNIEYQIPQFIISKNFNNVKIQDICNGLSFSRTLMENKFFLPNNLKFPYSRKLLENKIL